MNPDHQDPERYRQWLLSASRYIIQAVNFITAGTALTNTIYSCPLYTFLPFTIHMWYTYSYELNILDTVDDNIFGSSSPKLHISPIIVSTIILYLNVDWPGPLISDVRVVKWKGCLFDARSHKHSKEQVDPNIFGMLSIKLLLQEWWACGEEFDGSKWKRICWSWCSCINPW